MPELTREQHARIESLANEHGSVKVHRPTEDGTVVVEYQAGYSNRTVRLNEDGDEIAPVVENARVSLPIDVVRALIGDEKTDAALDMAAQANYPEFHVGSQVEADVVAEIRALASFLPGIES